MHEPALEAARRALAALATDEPYAQRLTEARNHLRPLNSDRVGLDPTIVEIIAEVFDERLTSKEHEEALVSAITTILGLC